MSDYIKREDAIFVALQQPLYSVVSQIKQLEGVDIVRCKECKRYVPYMKQFSHEPRGDGVCTVLRMTRDGFQEINVYDDHFCSYGEREGE